MDIGTLTSSRGHSWTLTDEDALWLARAIVGESVRDAEAIASTMLRRLAYVSDSRGRAAWPSLTALVVGTESSPGYSQPVAVQWRDRGDPTRLARRERIRSLPWSEIPAHVRTTVLELFTGTRRLAAAGAVHFADAATARRFLAANPGSIPVHRGANTFIAMPGSMPGRYRDPSIVATADGLALAYGQTRSRLLSPLVLVALATLILAVVVL